MNTPFEWKTLSRGAVVAGGLVLISQMGTAASPDCLNSSPFDCQRTDLADQDFSGRALIGANFRAARLTDVTFDGASMAVALFDRATLRQVTFVNADLIGSSFTGASLEDVSFAGANLRGARFDGADMEPGLLGPALTCLTTMPNDVVDNSDC